jgi:hypothetical protein
MILSHRRKDLERRGGALDYSGQVRRKSRFVFENSAMVASAVLLGQRGPMAKKKAVRKNVRKSPAVRKRRTMPRGRATRPHPVLAAVKGAERRDIGHVRLEVGRAGAARVKRMVYPAGFRWSVDMKPIVGTDLCMHAHVGFLTQGEIHIEYADGCVVEHKAPQIVAIEPGHDGWVVGNEPVVMIEFDFEGDTIRRLGMPDTHRHR